MNLVIGSGPAGVAAAQALVDQGQPVTMLDAGFQLEPERQPVVDRLRSQSYDQWKSADMASLRENTEADAGGIPLKRIYGSRYPVRGVSEYVMEDSPAFTSLSSLAEGGLSSLWGGAVLPYSENDLRRWPIGLKELAPHYRKILQWMPFSARSDALESHYPLYADNPAFLTMSHQAEHFYSAMNQNKTALEKNGFYFGAARLAVRPNTTAEGPGCVYCGLCLYGCPYGLIYNSAQTLAQLQKNNHFHYRSGLLVDRITEKNGAVEVTARNLSDGTSGVIQGSRVFLGAGVLASARIMLRSMEASAHELTLKTSQHFILPLLRFHSVADVAQERLHTLAQIYIEYLDSESPQDNIHCQIYTFSDLYPQALENSFGRFFRAMGERLLMGRLLILQGYLHSDFSPTFTARLDASQQKIRVRSQIPPQAHAKTWALARRLFRRANLFKAVPVLPLMRISQPGGGAHLGGTFPMRKAPAAFETDLLGRPSGFSRLHLVDASTFPDIPPTTITLTIMANAYRIASEAPHDA